MLHLINDVKIVYDDLMFIYNNYYLTSGMIIQCKFPSYNEKCSTIGNDKYRISRKNYHNDFLSVGENQCYSIQLEDESLLSIFYEFDNKGKIQGFEISFIPSFNSNILFKNPDEFGIISKYIRIDYDRNSYKKITHPRIHLHNNLERDGLRIPLDNIVYPSEFLYIILRYYYDYEWKELKQFLSLSVKDIGTLDTDEKKLFYLMINGA